MSSSTPAASAAPPKYLLPSRRSVLLMGLTGLAGLALILYAWQLGPFASAIKQTDDAHVRGQVTVLSAKVAGHITEVLVDDFAQVEAGQPLLRIDPRPFEQKLAQARAELAQARAGLAASQQTLAQDAARIDEASAALAVQRSEREQAQRELARYRALGSQQLVARNDVERLDSSAHNADARVAQAQAQIRIAQQSQAGTRTGQQGLAARVATAEAAVAMAELDLEQTLVRAPRAGQLSETGVHVGQYVASGSQLLYLVPDQVWVVANFKETQAGAMAPGQPAELAVDAFGGQVLRGHVQSLAPATGSEFALLKPDNASGNFTKVVQRLPVRISIDPGQPLASRLRPGMSVAARVDTSAPAAGLQQASAR